MSNLSYPPPVFTRFLRSGDITIVQGSLITFVHNFGRRVGGVRLLWKCTVANNGYLVGDEKIAGFEDSNSADRSLAVVDSDPNNVRVMYPAYSPQMQKFDTGPAAVGVSPTEWDLVIEVWV